MSKGKIITFSIISFIVLLNIILFGFVFRLRKQQVITNDANINSEKIIEAASLKEGKSIFLLDKQTAISNIEKAFANVKVVHIKTINLTTIQFVLRARYPLYYAQNSNEFYILDEELKVLEIVNTEPSNLIKIDTAINFTDASVSSFVGTEQQKNMVYNLFSSVYEAVIETKGKQARDDVSKLIKSINISNENRLIALTSYGVKLDIEKPLNDFTRKINICFTYINSKINDGKQTELENATIKIFYDAEGKEYSRFIE